MIVGDDNKVVVYSKTNCPQCVVVKRELSLRGVDFTEVNIDTPESKQKAVAQMLVQRGHRQVPVIYVDGKHVADWKTITAEMIDP